MDSAAPPQIDVHLYAGAGAEFGAQQVRLPGATVEDVVAALLASASPRARTVIDRSSLLLNGSACRDRGRTLAPGDRLDVLPPFAGG